MRSRSIVLLTSGLLTGFAAATSSAAADDLVVKAPGAQQLAAGERYLAWAAPTRSGRWQIQIRTPKGTTTTARARSFGAAPDVGIGRLAGRVTLVYSRCAGRSATRACDVYRYDVRARSERRVARAARRSVSETAPSLSGQGRLAWVRRTGSRRGIYTATATGEPQRRYSHVASETAVVGEYVAFIDSTPYLPNGCCTVVRAVRTTGTARDLLSFGTQVGTLPFALTGVGRRAFHLRLGAAPSGTIELDPEGRGHRDVSTPARFALPLSTNSIAAAGSRIDLYLDAEGIKRLSRPLYGVPG